MTTAQPHAATLRLIRPADDPSSPRGIDESQGVAAENRAAAGLDPAAMREAFAAGVAAALDGGEAAILTPERRRRLVALADRLGIRAFDANLVIAVVQDRVRRGEDWRTGLALTRPTSTSAAKTHGRPVSSRQISIAITLGLALAAALIAWTLGAV